MSDGCGTKWVHLQLWAVHPIPNGIFLTSEILVTKRNLRLAKTLSSILEKEATRVSIMPILKMVTVLEPGLAGGNRFMVRKIFGLDDVLPSGFFLDYAYETDEGSIEGGEDASGKTLRFILTGAMREARIAGFNYVIWGPLLNEDLDIVIGKRQIKKLAVQIG